MESSRVGYDLASEQQRYLHNTCHNLNISCLLFIISLSHTMTGLRDFNQKLFALYDIFANLESYLV